MNITLNFFIKTSREEKVQSFFISDEKEIAEHRFKSACASILAHVCVLCRRLHLAVACSAEDILLCFVKQREQFFRFLGLRYCAHNLDDLLMKGAGLACSAHRHACAGVQALHGVADECECHRVQGECFFLGYRFFELKFKIFFHEL